MTIAQVPNHNIPLCRAIRFGLMAAIVLGVALLTPGARAEPPVSPGTQANSQNATSDAPGDAGIATSEEHKLPQVTVEARRQLERRINEFVRKITNVPFSFQDSLPLWHDPLCFAVAGLPTNEGLFALGRLADIARSTGLRVSHPGCKYNFIVIFSAEPDKLLQRAFHLHPGSFNTDGGFTEIKQFIAPAKPLPVRAWHNKRAVTRAGAPISRDGPCGSFAVNGVQVPVGCHFGGSFIERYDVYAFSLALVVIDTSYPKEFELRQLIDYAAMVGLADIPASEDPGDAPSILRLFGESPDAQTPGLTAWDSAFLRALYHSDQANTTQRSQIAVQMVHEVLR